MDSIQLAKVFDLSVVTTDGCVQLALNVAVTDGQCRLIPTPTLKPTVVLVRVPVGPWSNNVALVPSCVCARISIPR